MICFILVPQLAELTNAAYDKCRHRYRSQISAVQHEQQIPLTYTVFVAITEILCTHSGDINSSRQNTNVHEIVDDSTVNVT